MRLCGCISEHQPVGIRSITQYVLEDLMAAVHWTGVPRAHTPVVLVRLSAKSVNLCLQGGAFIAVVFAAREYKVSRNRYFSLETFGAWWQ